ncbi:transposase [Legionella septentrionalis]|uniref:transposase n=1 Tax=Legionella septentrionalis TaxID=2498109 RepID=UPI000F8F4E50|nr:transposase [Legionella septentrionalis]RUQ95653.1 hypothetical protein ELY11_09080 [Legionella septentrionalis]
MSRFVIDDAMWNKLEQLLPTPKGRHGENDRLFIEQLLDHQDWRAKVDSFGLPLSFILTPGQDSKIKTAKDLLGDELSEYLLADKAYDGNEFREELTNRGITAVIPSKKNRIIPIEHDPYIHRA